MKVLNVRWAVVGSYVAVAALSVWSTALLLLPGSITKGAIEPFVGLAGTLIGAFLGAWSAFKLQSRRDHLRERERERSAAVLVFVTVSQMVNRLWNLRHQIVTPHRQKNFRHFLMPVIPRDERVDLKVDLAALSFLLTKGDDINVIGEVTTAAWSFEEALKSIAARSDAWSTLVKPRMREFADANPSLGGRMPVQFFDSLPVTTGLEMRQLTDSMVKILDEEIERIGSTANTLGEKIAVHFPEVKVRHRVEVPPEEVPFARAVWSDRWTSYYRRPELTNVTIEGASFTYKAATPR